MHPNTTSHGMDFPLKELDAARLFEMVGESEQRCRDGIPFERSGSIPGSELERIGLFWESGPRTYREAQIIIEYHQRWSARHTPEPWYETAMRDKTISPSVYYMSLAQDLLIQKDQRERQARAPRKTLEQLHAEQDHNTKMAFICFGIAAVMFFIVPLILSLLV